MSTAASSVDLPGLDLVRLQKYLDQASPGLLGGPLSGSVITGGRSNLTYDITDGLTSVIVRRPPLGHVLATAHDVRREHTVMSALRITAVPVPAMHALCEDPEVLGAPFYVMSKSPGVAVRDPGPLEAVGHARTQSISERLVDVLAQLHRIEPEQVGLGEFGRAEGFLGRQVRRWVGQLELSHSRELPALDELGQWLESHVPERSARAVIHGDYRLDNLLLDLDSGTDAVTSVLDWEMSTLGDPLTDLATTVVYRKLADLDGAEAVSTAPRAPGFLGADELIARYAQTREDIGSLGFHLALAGFKLAVILEGIHFRHRNGQTVGEGFDRLGDLVEPVTDTALRSRHSYR